MRSIGYGFFVWILLATSTGKAGSVKDDPGPQDCDALYYGIEKPRDLGKALQCYRDQKKRDYVITMLLNGEGATYDPRKIDEVFDEWQAKDPEDADSLIAKTLKGIWADRKSGKTKSNRYIDYCKDIALDTPSMNECVSLDNRRKEIVLRNEIQRLSQHLDPNAKKSLAKLSLAFTDFSDTERMRIYQLMSFGTARHLVASSQEQVLRANFLTRLRTIVGERRLTPVSESEYAVADKNLNTVYQSSFSKLSAEDAKDYRAAAKAAQIAWIKYRDAWAALVTAAKIGDSADINVRHGSVRAVRTLITLDRVTELKNNPFEGN